MDFDLIDGSADVSISYRSHASVRCSLVEIYDIYDDDTNERTLVATSAIQHSPPLL